MSDASSLFEGRSVVPVRTRVRTHVSVPPSAEAAVPAPSVPEAAVPAPSAPEASVPAPSAREAYRQADPPVAEDRPVEGMSPKLSSTRASRAWMKVLPALLLLAVILLFVFQNLRHTKVSFATASGNVPLALALVAAAALGGLLVLALGSVRILQLRKVIRGYRRSEAHRRSRG